MMNYEVKILNNGDRLFTHKDTNESFIKSEQFIERYNLIGEYKDLAMFSDEEKKEFLLFIQTLFDIEPLRN